MVQWQVELLTQSLLTFLILIKLGVSRQRNFYLMEDQTSKPKQVLFYLHESPADGPRMNFVSFDGIANFFFG